MKSKVIYMVLALTIAIGGGILMNQSFADETYSYINVQAPESCICSAPADLSTNLNHFSRFQSGIKADLEPTFLMTLLNCQCGEMTCAVSTQAISCMK
jgi:hypothetical protein